MNNPVLSLIVAMDRNRLIGANGRLPWRLPADMAWFKKQTIGKPVIMGRKTYESIPPRFRPLAGRQNIILTRNLAYQLDAADGETAVCHTPAAALSAARHAEEIFIIGGAAIYAAFLPQVQRLYLTQIDAALDGDTYLPPWDEKRFSLIFEEAHSVDEQHAYPFRFQIWQAVGHADDF